MRPFAIKGLGSQYTKITTLLRGDTKGYSDNAVFDDNEQMTAYGMYRNPLRMETSQSATGNCRAR